jgi:hypothetical protein
VISFKFSPDNKFKSTFDAVAWATDYWSKSTTTFATDKFDAIELVAPDQCPDKRREVQRKREKEEALKKLPYLIPADNANNLGTGPFLGRSAVIVKDSDPEYTKELSVDDCFKHNGKTYRVDSFEFSEDKFRNTILATEWYDKEFKWANNSTVTSALDYHKAQFRSAEFDGIKLLDVCPDKVGVGIPPLDTKYKRGTKVKVKEGTTPKQAKIALFQGGSLSELGTQSKSGVVADPKEFLEKYKSMIDFLWSTGESRTFTLVQLDQPSGAFGIIKNEQLITEEKGSSFPEGFSPILNKAYYINGAKGYISRPLSQEGNPYKSTEWKDKPWGKYIEDKNRRKVNNLPLQEFIKQNFPGLSPLPEKYFIFYRGDNFRSGQYMLLTSFKSASQQGGTRRKRSVSKAKTRSKTSKRRTRSRSNSTE